MSCEQAKLLETKPSLEAVGRNQAEPEGGAVEKITSFTINHLLLEPGVYVSRKDSYPVGVSASRDGAASDRDGVEGDVPTVTITTFDLRMTAPNDEPVMNTAEVHAIEHLGATFLRNDSEWSSRVSYFGPMGCRTGFYLLLAGDYESRDILGLVTRMFEFIRDFEGEVPGATPRDCGNYHDISLPMAKWWARRYLDSTLYDIDEAHLTYPE